MLPVTINQMRQRYNTPDLKDILPNQKVLTVFVRFVKNRNIFHLTSDIKRSDIGIIGCGVPGKLNF